MRNSEDLFDAREKARNEIKEWRSAPLNVVAADQAGNIAYMLLSASPIRGSDEVPYTGC